MSQGVAAFKEQKKFSLKLKLTEITQRFQLSMMKLQDAVFPCVKTLASLRLD